jgi:hypothetical protein
MGRHGRLGGEALYYLALAGDLFFNRTAGARSPAAVA